MPTEETKQMAHASEIAEHFLHDLHSFIWCSGVLDFSLLFPLMRPFCATFQRSLITLRSFADVWPVKVLHSDRKWHNWVPGYILSSLKIQKNFIELKEKHQKRQDISSVMSLTCCASNSVTLRQGQFSCTQSIGWCIEKNLCIDK